MSSWRVAASLSAPLLSVEHRLCLRGYEADEATESEIRARVLATPEDFEARLLLIGSRTRHRQDRDDLVLPMIDAHPEFDIESFWAVSAAASAAAREAWENVLARSPDATVCANAAWSTINVDVEFALSALQRGEQAIDADARWYVREAAFFEGRMDAASEDDERQRYAGLGLRAMLRAFATEPDTQRRMRLLWPARQFAKEAKAANASHLLREADLTAKELANCHDEQRVLTVAGLVALAGGDVTRAEEHLTASISYLVASRTPSMSLARALEAAGSAAHVTRFLEACLAAPTLEIAMIGEWLLRLRK